MAKGVKPLQHVRKKELKEDKLVTTYFQSRDYFSENKNKIIKIGGAVILIIALTAFWFTSKRNAEYQAAYEMGVALTAAQAVDPAALADDFNQIAERFSGTTAGNEALMYTAQMHMMADQKEEALEAYDRYLQKGRKSAYLYPSALAGKASCLEDLGRFNDAAQVYLQAASVKKNFFLAPRFHLDAARCYRLAGESERARTECELIETNFPDSPFAREAIKEAARL
ncbi:hypothetical protein CEE37_03805 [candidate division LCP-89 bacterium B3_LCP]|uniref:Uncharacterized protein n=1 Tax=candidate division LCP-89 bacterium B3_LCP TaxID=2012998 RepID=A0A532V3B0_UNCL8|nr:MAG: hypothetical protein CEE37_03805 [candidate division LCP-89 bacterium B3_LCP]